MWIPERAAGLSAVYGGSVPSLRKVVLHEVRIDCARGLLYLRVDLDEFPDRPPEKWRAAGFNAVQVKLQLAGVRALEIRGSVQGVPQECEMDVAEDDGLEFRLSSGSLLLTCTAEIAMIGGISAYCDGAREG